VLGNFALWTLLLVVQAGIKLFLGELRAQELELLSDNLRPTIMSLLFFLTVFRTQFNASFIGALILLLCCKAVHWVVEARVNSMEQSPSDSNMTYVLLFSLILICFLVDHSVVFWAASTTIASGPSLALLVGFEFCILALKALSSMVMFVLNLIAIKRDRVWYEKGTYVLYLEFFNSALQSLVYLAFFFIIFRYYGLPLHIVRSMYFTFAAFQRSLSKLLTYRRAVSGMDRRYPDASPEDLQQVDSICIVCRDEMETGKKLPCGHILHAECLRSWLQQDPSCPLCRKSVIIEDLYRQDPQTYAVEYDRFINRRAAPLAANAPFPHLQQNNNHNNNNNNHQNPPNNNPNAHETVGAGAWFVPPPNGSTNADLTELKEQMVALKTQMDFIQSLIIAQMEQQQEQTDGQAKMESSQETEDEIRKRRLQFYK
jgi:E3 ubiquitin-protein ligase synoviolin